jgi:uncharacterized protein (DUF2235 family)
MRRLIVCADGTWNKDEKDANGGGRTNVAIVKDSIAAVGADGVPQVVFYDRGVGTGKMLDRWFGGAFGAGISRNIRDDCYGFLVEHFEPGDELFFFGFSRGAYTVRSLSGMVRKCGIIRRSPGKRTGDPSAGSGRDAREQKLIEEAYDFYRDSDPSTHPTKDKAVRFRAEHSHETKIKCLCVWDTVGALGIPTSGPVGMISKQRHEFHDVKLSSHVLNAFHALAVDERRKPFAPALWEIPADDPALASGQWTIEQRWFAGVHSNVGGGYPDCGLSHLTLGWMAKKASACGLTFKPGFLDEVKQACTCEGVRYESLSTYYKLLGELRRPLLAPRVDKDKKPVKTFEVVDSSVAERCHATKPLVRPDDKGYRPPNFMAWWKENPTTWEKYRYPG